MTPREVRYCRAIGCDKRVGMTRWFCGGCWLLVPKDIKLRMFDHFDPKRAPDGNFVRALAAAIRAVGDHEARRRGA